MNGSRGEAPRRRKVWKRTWVGGLISVAVAVLLWALARSGNPTPVFAAGWVLALAAVFEVSRMGRLAAFRFGLPLLAALIACFVHWCRTASATPPSDREWFEVPWIAFSVALGVHGCFRLGQSERAFSKVAGWALGAYLAGWVVLLATRGEGDRTAQLAWLALPTVVFLVWGAAHRSELAPLLAAGALSVWIFPPMQGLGEIQARFGLMGLVLLIGLAKIGDVFGYYVGNAIGRTHPFPKVSPGKTTAGCVASLVAGGAFGALCSAAGWFPSGPLGIAGGLLAGLSINLAAQSGDLLESWVKRRAEVKDSGPWFGPSGGVLDVVDSLLLAAPAALVSWPVFFGSGPF